MLLASFTPLITQSIQSESQSKSQFTTQSTSDYTTSFQWLRKPYNNHGQNISLSDETYNIVNYSPEKDTLNRQITVSTTHINTIQIHNSINNLINHTIMQTNQITLDLFTIYPAHRLKFAFT